MTSIAPSAKRIEVFRPGTFKPMVGDAITFSPDDLKSIARSYNVSAAPAPAVVGHPKTDDPAYGWAKSFSFDEKNQRLVAELDQIEPAFADAVSAGRYKKISLELFSPGAPNNPAPGSWYPKHIGFLGAVAPAVPGLKPVAFAEGGDGVVTFVQGEDASAAFSEPALRDVAQLFRSLREFIIEKFGSDTADKALPNWTIGWIDDSADRDRDPAFSENQNPKDTSMSGNTAPADFAQRLADIEARERQLGEREKQARHQANASFAEKLVGEGRLLPALKDKTVALLNELGNGAPAQVSFAEGDATVAKTPADLLSDILAASPVIVSFADVGKAHPAPGAGATVAFAAPAGAEVDASALDTFAKAKAYQAANPSASWIDAVTAVS